MPINLITAEEEEALPEDDDAAAFVKKERICRDEMNRILASYGQNDDATEVWMEYIVQVRAAGVTYGVVDRLPPMPKKPDYDAFWQFYEGAVTTSSTLSRQARSEKSAGSVTLTPGEKARLQKHLSELKAALEASSLSVKLKENLKKRLEGFEEELEKERSNLARIIVTASLVVTSIGAAAGAALGALGKAEDSISKLPATFEAIAKIAGHAKTEEIERLPTQQMLPAPPRALPRPARQVEEVQVREKFDLDDEIPF